MDIDPLQLSEEELNFELVLRHITNLGLTTRRVKCIRLRDAMTEDVSYQETYTSFTHAMDDSTSIEMCQSRIRLVLPAIDSAKKKQDIGFLEHVSSRLRHYLYRITRIRTSPAHL